MIKSYNYKTGNTLNTVYHILEDGGTKCKIELNDYSTDIEFYSNPEKLLDCEAKELKPIVNADEVFSQYVSPCLDDMLSCKFEEWIYCENHRDAQTVFPMEIGKYDTPTRWQITICDKWIRLTSNHKKVTTIRKEIKPCTQLEFNTIKLLLEEIKTYLAKAF